MKKLDFYLQKTGLILCSALLLTTIFYTPIFICLAYGMLFLAAYQISHFIIYLIMHIPWEKEVKLSLLIYPLLVIVFFTFWLLVFRNTHKEFMMYLYAFHALAIGAYYCFAVHEKL